LRRNLGNLGLVLLERGRERRSEVLRLDRLERRQQERRRPLAEQRIAGGFALLRRPCRLGAGRLASPLRRLLLHRRCSSRHAVAFTLIGSPRGGSKPANRPDAGWTKKKGRWGNRPNRALGT